ncbi:MAG: cytochrome c [Bacteroidia bacterium]|nr:cytochrome c [Bacteroidia bacterium]
MKKILKISMIALLSVTMYSCGSDSNSEATKDEAKKPATSMIADEVDPMDSKGIGPISSLTLADEVDATMAASGEEIFQAKCSACHKTDVKFIGPSPKGVLERRSPEWVMNMILNPEEMVANDPIAKELLVEYNMSPMANQNLTEEEARSVLEYFRTL